MRTMPSRAVLVSASCALLCATTGCDPREDPGVWAEGPPFLILGSAAEQPPSVDDGTSVYVQARGGSFVSIVTYGCKHRYTSLGLDATASCAELPGSEPLYLFVKAIDRDCQVESRLYADCDLLGDAGLGEGACGSHGAFIASAVLSVASRSGKDGAPVDALSSIDMSRADADAIGANRTDAPAADDPATSADAREGDP